MPATLCLLLLTAAPWQLVEATAEAPAAIDLVQAGVTLSRLELSAAGERARAELHLSTDNRPARRRLLVGLFDQAKQPLAGGTVELSANQQGRVTLDLGAAEVAAAVRFAAAGVESQIAGEGSLISAVNGGRVVEMSSNYGGGYGPATLIDGGAGVWASATGQIAGQWFIVAMPNDAEQTIAAIGINPTGEPNYRECAVRDWVLYASTDGTAEGDFVEILAGTCDDRDELQRFELPQPVPARYLKLVMLTNRGSDRWMELTEFEAYAPPVAGGDEPPPAEPLVVLLEEFRADQAVIHEGGDARNRLFELTLGMRNLTADTLRSRRLAVAAPLPGFSLLDVEADAAGRRRWTVNPVNCRQAAFDAMAEGAGAERIDFGRFEFDFGNLLGGATQYAAAILDLPLPERTSRVQLRARAAQPGNLLRSTVWDSRREWFLFQYAKIDWRGWRTASIALDPAAAVMHGGEERGNLLDPPLVLVQVSINPTGRESIRGTVDVDDLLALRAPL